MINGGKDIGNRLPGQVTESNVLYVGLDRAIPCEGLEVMTDSAVVLVVTAAICSVKLAIICYQFVPCIVNTGLVSWLPTFGALGQSLHDC